VVGIACGVSCGFLTSQAVPTVFLPLNADWLRRNAAQRITLLVRGSFVASCKRSGVEPFAWFNDVISRIPAHSITRLSELLPHNWQSAAAPAEG